MKNLLTQGNSKLKKDGIWTFSLPAGKTCPCAGACRKGCYAMAGRYVTGAVKALRERNYEATQTSTFYQRIMEQIDRQNIGIVRIHDSGDFYSLNYLIKWAGIAKFTPECLFYAYTKSIPLVNVLMESAYLPDNLRLIFSYGGEYDCLINPDVDRHAKVFKDYAALIAAGYTDASDSDILALGEEKKIGLVYHGQKKFENTEWKGK